MNMTVAFRIDWYGGDWVGGGGGEEKKRGERRGGEKNINRREIEFWPDINTNHIA